MSDPRTGRHPRHYFGEIIFMALAAIICQCEGFDDMARFAKLKEKWLKKTLKLPHGTPSNDTFRRVFSMINVEQFNTCFMTFVRATHGELSEQLIAIDGKAMRHSFDTSNETKHLHLLSAWACEKGISLAQLAVDTKTNEIKEIPKLLDLLDLEGHTVSLDAMGCQKAIARKIHLAGADYLLALKGNHSTFHKRVREFFGSPAQVQDAKQRGKTITTCDAKNKGHGRDERRVVIEAHREEISTGKNSVEKRYYLSSREPDATALQQLIRQHWGIENQCHSAKPTPLRTWHS